MGSGKKNLKATKKFEKRHLTGVLDKRKAGAKIKQRQQIKDKQKSRRAKDAEYIKGSKEDGDAGPATGDRRRDPRGGKVKDMTVDDFFQGGFDEIIDAPQPAKAASLGKRKRNGVTEKAPESDSEASLSPGPTADGPDASDDDDDDDASDASEPGAMSKKTMEDLAKTDPEFYKYLQENDPEALEFDDKMGPTLLDDLSGDEDSAKEDAEPSRKRSKTAAGASSGASESAPGAELTRSIVASWRKQMTEKKSLTSTRHLVIAFRCAAQLNEEDDDEGTGPRWVINSPEVFNDVLTLALTEIPTVMNHHLPIKESAAGRVYVQTEGKKFKTLTLLLKSYTSSIMHLLGTLSDDKTLKLTLSALTPILPYLLSFKKLIKALAKSVVNFWAQPASSETTRITAFLVIRRLVVIGDKGIRETALKAVYQGLVQGCRVTNHNTIQGINLMKNSAAELWGIDQGVGYTTAFTFIRQLAIHLRNSIVHNKNDSFRIVYNWQFTHSLDFWSRVLAEHCNSVKEAEKGKESQMRLLIYPLVQVTLGAMRLIPTALYFPLRFHLVRSLLRTSRATGTYIPLASPLLEVLASNEMRKPPKPTSLKPLDFAVAYKAPKSYLRTRVYQDGIGEQLVELLTEFLLLWSTSIAFPELALPIVIQLKRWLKNARSPSNGNKNGKLVSQLVLVVQKIEANAKFIEQQRAKIDFAPRDRSQVDTFLRDYDIAKTPLGAYAVAQRKVREERARLFEEARKDDDRRRKEDEMRAVDDGEEDNDVSGADDDEDEDEDELDVVGESDAEDDVDEEDDEE